MSPKVFKTGSRSVPQPCKTFPIEKITIKNYASRLTQTFLISISRVRRKLQGLSQRLQKLHNIIYPTVAALRSFIISLALRVWLVNLPRKACVASRSGPLLPLEPSPPPNTRCSCRTKAPPGCRRDEMIARGVITLMRGLRNGK